jgi:FlaA1/EpsC-like NDP-sugar epimerase
MGSGGEIYIFDMGKPVKIYDLAVKMITLAGLEPGRDIEIRETGLRPGEKLYEELLATKENTIPTYHSKIMIGKTRKSDPVEVHNDINALLQMLKNATNFELVRAMKAIVPEYISQNSVYEHLDQVKSKENTQQTKLSNHSDVNDHVITD